MEWLKENPIVLIPLALLLAFLVLPLLDKAPKKPIKRASVASETRENTGFPDYDLLPEALKRE